MNKSDLIKQDIQQLYTELARIQHHENQDQIDHVTKLISAYEKDLEVFNKDYKVDNHG